MHTPTLPCPVCGEDPEHGVTDKGHIYFCSDHPRLSGFGQTEEEAAKNWNHENWHSVFADEPEEEEFDDDE